MLLFGIAVWYCCLALLPDVVVVVAEVVVAEVVAADIEYTGAWFLHTAVSAAMDHMDLNRYRHQTTITYSGGNKRKLALAIALVAAPQVVFLGTCYATCRCTISTVP